MTSTRQHHVIWARRGLVLAVFIISFCAALYAGTHRAGYVQRVGLLPEVPDCAGSPEPRPLLELRLRLAHAQGQLQLLHEEFVDVLGPPQPVPPDLDPRFGQPALETLLDELRADHPVWVDCDLYPCAIVVHSAADGRGLTSLDELKDWFVDRGYPHLVVTGSTLNTYPGPSFSSWSVAVLQSPPDPLQERWARSVAARAGMRARVEVADR